VTKLAKIVRTPLRFRQSGRRPIKTSFLQSKTWETIGNFCAFLVSAILFFAGAPVLIVGLTWFLVGAGLVFVWPNYDYAKRRKEADEAYQLELQKDPRKQLLVGAESHLRALGKSIDKLPRAVSQHVDALHTRATAILNAVDADIAKSVPIVPFFTTDLPEAARLATERGKLTDKGSAKRKAQIDQALEARTYVFASAETAMMAPALASVDIDMRLLGDAMDVEVQDVAR
jgi:hypothetical protein